MPVAQTSKEAHIELSRLSCEAQRLEILRQLRDAGERPLCRKMITGGKYFHAISGRFTELRDWGLIDDKDTGRVKWDNGSHSRVMITDKGREALRIGCTTKARPERHPAVVGKQGALFRTE